jgi:hypothetical protein
VAYHSISLPSFFFFTKVIQCSTFDGWGIKEDKDIHGAFKEGLGRTKDKDVGI